MDDTNLSSEEISNIRNIILEAKYKEHILSKALKLGAVTKIGDDKYKINENYDW